MKDFENNMNEQNEQNEQNMQNTQNTQNEQNTQNIQNTPETRNEPQAQPVNHPEQPVPQQPNPYYHGYAPAQNTQNTQNVQNGQNTQNPGNPQGYTPYTSYTRAGTQNGQNPQNGYCPAEHAGGQISYTPSYQQTPKARKPKKPVSRGALAVVCSLTLVFSACFGFGGAMLANHMQDDDEPAVVYQNEGTHNSTADNPVVIYRNTADVPTSAGKNGQMTYSQVAAMVKDSVVEIVTDFNNQSVWFQFVTQGAGSGVIISEDGYIITNAHVITDESSGAVADHIMVRLTNGSEYTAEAIAFDTDADIAIIKIEETGLHAAQCGDSDKIAVGEEMIVVGNPLGELGGTVTNGIVSATEREIQMGGVTMRLIQTNAAVNPGNSGGGMFNMNGQLIGIVNAKSSGTGIEGLGFAIPINSALEVSEQLLQYGYVRGKTMIGVSFQDVSSSNFYFYYDIKPGVYVAALSEGFNDKNLQVGDRVIAVNGTEITSSSDIKSIVTSASVGDTLTFQLYRDNKLLEVEVTCFERVPDEQANIQFDKNQPEEETKKDSGSTVTGKKEQVPAEDMRTH